MPVTCYIKKMTHAENTFATFFDDKSESEFLIRFKNYKKVLQRWFGW